MCLNLILVLGLGWLRFAWSIHAVILDTNDVKQKVRDIVDPFDNEQIYGEAEGENALFPLFEIKSLRVIERYKDRFLVELELPDQATTQLAVKNDFYFKGQTAQGLRNFNIAEIKMIDLNVTSDTLTPMAPIMPPAPQPEASEEIIPPPQATEEPVPVEPNGTEPSVPAATEKIHRVKKGDTLWDITQYYLNDPFLWPSVWELNKDHIQNPHLIYPEQEVLLLERLRSSREGIGQWLDGSRSNSLLKNDALSKQFRDKIGLLFDNKSNKKRLQTKLKTSTQTSPEIVKLVESEEFMKLFSEDFYNACGFISPQNLLEGEGQILSTRKAGTTLRLYDRLQINFNQYKTNIGAEFNIFRIGEKVFHPKTKQMLGYLVRIVGKLKITQVSDNSASGEIIKQYDLILENDRVVPYTPIPVPIINGYRRYTDNEISGFIVKRKNDSGVVFKYDIFYIDRGNFTLIQPGDIFHVYPGKANQRNLLAEGVAMVLDVKEQSATVALIKIFDTHIRIGDQVILTHQAEKNNPRVN